MEKGEVKEDQKYVFLTLISLNECNMKDEVAWAASDDEVAWLNKAGEMNPCQDIHVSSMCGAGPGICLF